MPCFFSPACAQEAAHSKDDAASGRAPVFAFPVVTMPTAPAKGIRPRKAYLQTLVSSRFVRHIFLWKPHLSSFVRWDAIIHRTACPDSQFRRIKLLFYGMFFFLPSGEEWSIFLSAVKSCPKQKSYWRFSHPDWMEVFCFGFAGSNTCPTKSIHLSTHQVNLKQGRMWRRKTCKIYQTAAQALVLLIFFSFSLFCQSLKPVKHTRTRWKTFLNALKKKRRT